MNEPYLILHKVRGEPAFDIATQIEVEDEVWWIIPTSGHRAYPYWHRSVEKMDACLGLILDMPDDHPDHYAINNGPITHQPPGPNSLLTQLGLARDRKLVRRV